MLHPPWTWLIIAYVLMSIITAIMYAIDKQAARRGTRRIPERTLHTIAILFGWPGALVAQQLFKHKRQKTAFVLTTWIIAASHLGMWVMVARS